MIINILKWSGLLLMIRVRVANLQIPMPMPMPMPMFAMPQPMPQIFALPPPPPVAFPVPVPIPVPMPPPKTTTTTTSTTTEQNMGIAMPVPMPLPIQIAIPAMPPPTFCQSKPRAKNCPPCPPCVCSPSCTPSFFSFCSPCHQKCRCRKREDVPEPMPPRAPQPLLAPAYPMPVPMAPMMGPPPVVIMPYPSRKGRGKRPRKQDRSSEDSCSSESSEWGIGRRSNRRHSNRFTRNRRRSWRRNDQEDEREVREDELVKPVLTYVSNDGEVKLKRRISADEAAKLLDEREYVGKPYQTVKVIAGQNGAKQSQVVVVSDDGEEPQVAHRQKQVVLRRGASQRIIGEGRKELVFRPPDDKTISNLEMALADLISMTLPPDLAELSFLEDNIMEKPEPIKTNVQKKDKPKAKNVKPKPQARRYIKGPRRKTKPRKKPNAKPAKLNFPNPIIQKLPIPRPYASPVITPRPNENKANAACCDTVTCYPICPYMAAALPMYPVPPIVVPAQAYFEPVIHDHPPLEEMRRINKKEKKKKKKKGFTCSYEDSDSYESEYSSDDY